MALPNPHGSPTSPVHGQSTPTLDVSFERPNESALPPPPPLWPHRLSASFSAMADQIAATSQALALVPSTAFSGTDVSAELGVLKTRLDGIEQTQGRLLTELEGLKTQFTDRPREEGTTIEALEKKIDELSERVRLDQERLPARLHNARATVMKAPLKTPVAANGKPVLGFPSTRGEFEHITKERYDVLLKAYGQSLKGDTAAKRETLRVFAGIPDDGQ